MEVKDIIFILGAVLSAGTAGGFLGYKFCSTENTEETRLLTTTLTELNDFKYLIYSERNAMVKDITMAFQKRGRPQGFFDLSPLLTQINSHFQRYEELDRLPTKTITDIKFAQESLSTHHFQTKNLMAEYCKQIEVTFSLPLDNQTPAQVV